MASVIFRGRSLTVVDAIIARILELEQRSRDIVREAEDKRDTLDEILDEKKKELRKNIYTASEKRLENDKILILNKARNEADEQTSRAHAKISEMESFAQTHRDEWIDALYSRITGVTGNK